MTRSEIEEGNALIHNFLHPELEDLGYLFMLEYHCSWDEIMKAVEQIEQSPIDKEQFTVRIMDGKCTILHYRMGPAAIHFERESSAKILSVWECVVAFIQWYNQQQHGK